MFFESLKNTRIIFFHFSKQISYSPIHFVTKLETNFKNQNHTTHPKIWSFQEIFFKTSPTKLWNLKSPWESLICFTNVSYITLLNTTMESKLIKTKFSNFSLKNIIIKLKNSWGFSWRIRKRSVSYLEEMMILASPMIQQA